MSTILPKMDILFSDTGLEIMFSEELRILDRNTMEYMIDDLEAQVNQKNAEIRRLQNIIADLQK